jgi:acylphosphatase
MEQGRWLISGRVQGVGFRWFVREQARALKVRGWVRNNGDGTVELHAEGDRESLARLRDAVTAGPPGASVESISDAPGDGGVESLPLPFTVLR